jgi:ABC-2 type transport system ATP-binding protein
VENLIDPIIIVEDGKIIFQHSLEAISKGIHIRQYGSEPEGDETLYAEKGLGGWFGLSAGADLEGTGIDLELLFNGVIKDASKINSLIAGGIERD